MSSMQLLRIIKVLEMIQCSRSKIYSDIANGLFPAPIKSGRSSYFVEAEILAWIEARKSDRDAKIQVKSQTKSSAA